MRRLAFLGIVAWLYWRRTQATVQFNYGDTNPSPPPDDMPQFVGYDGNGNAVYVSYDALGRPTYTGVDATGSYQIIRGGMEPSFPIVET